jgi:hypothetical protein
VGDVILVIDDLKGWQPGQFEWLLHYEGEAKRQGQVITVRNGEAEVAVQPLFPQTLPDAGLPTDYPELLRMAEGKGLKDHAPDEAQPYLRLQAPGVSDRMKFIVALTPRRRGEGPEDRALRDQGLSAGQGPSARRGDGRLFQPAGRRAHSPPQRQRRSGRLGDRRLHPGADLSEGGGPQKPRRWFVADGSYLRRDGRVELDSLSKAFVVKTSAGAASRPASTASPSTPSAWPATARGRSRSTAWPRPASATSRSRAEPRGAALSPVFQAPFRCATKPCQRLPGLRSYR